MICKAKIPLKAYVGEKNDVSNNQLSDEVIAEILNLPYKKQSFDSEQIVKLNNVSIKYENSFVLRNIEWEIRRGEKWSLMGNNGSGKSTLLSLICADNPQSYACNISLFGNKRGSGESIWDIKVHSP